GQSPRHPTLGEGIWNNRPCRNPVVRHCDTQRRAQPQPPHSAHHPPLAAAMTSRLRKFMLTIHITCSVGWIGAALTYLALVVVAMTNEDEQILRAVWIALASTGWFAIVPLSLASLFTGLIMSLGTKWGLFRYYWVIFSFVLTIFA